MPLLSTRGAGSIRSFGFAGASAPLNTAIPSISGTTGVGNVLTSSTGTWSGTPPITFAYQWKRAGSNISGATSSTYTLIAADAGNAITVTVTATNPISAVAATSSATTEITYAPQNSVAPSVSGSTAIGSSLSTTNGTWAGYPSPTFAYQWNRSGSAIAGATSSTYTTVNGDAGTAITCTVTATNAAGTAPQVSSNNIAVLAVPGQAQYVSAGSYNWTAPAGVTSVSVVTVGGGGGGGGYSAGTAGGGALGWKNSVPVTPGNSYAVVVGAGGSFGGQWGSGGNGGDSTFTGDSGVQVGAQGGIGSTNSTTYRTPLYSSNGGYGGHASGFSWSGGGGGAGGYTGNGGSQDNSTGTGAPSGGAGGGGAPSNGTSGFYGGGGGVGILGQGTTGAWQGDRNGGTGGSGGGNGSNGGFSGNTLGGTYGGGGSGAWHSSGFEGWGGTSIAAGGAVRIIWGAGRAFPSTNTGNV
jgi:hypothetical protein